MILQPVFSTFPCSPLPSGTCRMPGLAWNKDCKLINLQISSPEAICSLFQGFCTVDIVEADPNFARLMSNEFKYIQKSTHNTSLYMPPPHPQLHGGVVGVQGCVAVQCFLVSNCSNMLIYKLTPPRKTIHPFFLYSYCLLICADLIFSFGR